MLNLRNFVRICDVTLRDGIQNLKSANTIFSKNLKNDIIYRLNNSNITNIEFGSNVSHKIKEMANTKDVLQSMNFDNLKSNLFLLVPNYNKYEELNSWVNINKVNRISLITACSETFVQKNTKMSLNENLDQIDKILNSSSDKIYILSDIYKFINLDNLIVYYNSLIYPTSINSDIIDYNNSVVNL